MGDQVICEVPAECTLAANVAEVVPEVAGGDYCQQNCDPCQVPAEFTPCPPNEQCTCRCDCGDYSSCCYQQPPKVQPIRPAVSLLRSTAPLETETIYKCSYIGNGGDGCRAKPVLPCNNLQVAKQPMENCTVQKLSYLPHCGIIRPAPIRPPENGLRFNGPLYAMTSQKHDFVPKGFCKRDAIKPINSIWKPTAPQERCTVNRLSYMPTDVCKNPPPKPIVQTANYERASGPFEKCTIQKLSYLPVCLPPKEHLPWAEKTRCIPPKYGQLCTTYNLSYIPNCKPIRALPIRPDNALKFLGADRNDGNTVYKLSYIGADCKSCRPLPVLPINGLAMPSGPMEKCTVHKLSYQPNCCVARTAPIRPKENCIKPSGPLYGMTTQKHDFVPKPLCRRSPIRPMPMICRPTTGMEKCTINKLSYMPVNVNDYRRRQPILPASELGRHQGPMEKCTTYKLSYIPNCILPKQPLPWARQSAYQKPTAPIEKCTIQKLSYGPPGTFSRCSPCCANTQNATRYPKAGICN